MRIVYVTQLLPFGNGETFIIPEVDALLAAGHELLIIPRSSADPVLHDDVGALLDRTRLLPRAAAILVALVQTLARHPRRTLRAFWRLRRTRPLRRGLSNAVATAQGMWVARLAREWGADHIHAHWAHLTATLAMGASEVSGIPWSFTAHRYDVVLNNLLAEKLQTARFGRFIAQEMLRVARRLVPPDAFARATVLHMGVPVPPRPLEAAPVRATPVVLCPGRLVPIKGQRHLLDAAAGLMARRIPFELWLAGDGPERDSLARRVHELGLGHRVRFLGTVPHAELLGLYRERQVDCVVLPSLDLGNGVHEGISVALIEAMAHGVPVIGTATGGMLELLDGGAGIVVPPGDAGALAEALERLLGSASLRAEVARAGRQRIQEEFDVVPIVRELVRWFRGEASDHRGRARLTAVASPGTG